MINKLYLCTTEQKRNSNELISDVNTIKPRRSVKKYGGDDVNQDGYTQYDQFADLEKA